MLEFEEYQYVELLLDSVESFQYDASVTKENHPQFHFTIPIQNVVALKIIEAQIPFSYYLINSFNNVFQLQEASGGGPITITFPVGNYNSGTFITELEAVLNAASPSTSTYTVTMDQAKGNFTITRSVANAFSLILPGIDDGSSSLKTFLGLPDGTSTSNSSGVLICPFVAQMSGPNYIYICSDTLGSYINAFLPYQSQPAKGNTGPEVTKVAVNAQPGGVIFYQDYRNDCLFDFPVVPTLNTIDFYLTLGPFITNVPLNLNGASFSLKVGLWLKRPIAFQYKQVQGGLINV